MKYVGNFLGQLIYFMDIWYISWSFWYIFPVLVYFSRFWYVVQKKSGNPGAEESGRRILNLDRLKSFSASCLSVSTVGPVQ
jgi:hypothetical protein